MRDRDTSIRVVVNDLQGPFVELKYYQCRSYFNEEDDVLLPLTMK